MPVRLPTRPLALTLCVALSPAILPSSTTLGYSGGPAAGGIDRTGSPVAIGNTCAACHSGGSDTTITTFRVLDGVTPVTELDPGASYVLELQVTNSSFALFGAQLVGLDASNAQAGTFGATSTANTQLSTLNGRTYLEHDGRSSTGILRASWTAPATAGDVTFYYMGMGVNGAGTAGDRPSAPGTTTLTVLPPPCVDTDADALCDDVDPDDDNDGVLDGDDLDALDPASCQDLDGDMCDDCSVGTDGFGPLPDSNIADDGSDLDGDTLCDAGDDDDDNDGVADTIDPDALDPDTCGDSDGDMCDDCSVGTDNFGPLADNDTSNDGPDDDADGICNAGDICVGNDATGDTDNDGICNDQDICLGADATMDTDMDGVCDNMDLCAGDDATGDTDNDGVCDDRDQCLGDDAMGDVDGDAVCDDVDACQGDDTTGDSDNDGLCDDIDLCQGDDATGDANMNGICDGDEMMPEDMGSDDMEMDMEMDMDVSDMGADMDIAGDMDPPEDMAAAMDDMGDDMMPSQDDMGGSMQDMSAPDLSTMEDMGSMAARDPGEIGGGGCATSQTTPGAPHKSLIPVTLLAIFGLLLGTRRRRHLDIRK